MCCATEIPGFIRPDLTSFYEKWAQGVNFCPLNRATSRLVLLEIGQLAS